MATVRCTWTAVLGVDGYNVYLKSNGSFIKQNSVLITDTVYDIENLEDGNYEAYATSVLNSVESDASNVKGFEIGASSAIVEDDFSQYADTAAMKVNWDSVWNAVDYELHGGATEIGNKALDQTAMGTNARRFIRYNSQGETTGDVEVLALISASTALSFQYYIVLHGSGSAGDENGYFAVRATSGSQGFRVQKCVNGSFTNLATVAKTWTASVDTYNWIRFRREGTSLKAKVWDFGSSEPSSWNIDVTDTSLSSGHVGLTTVVGSGIKRLDYFAVSNGETIPVPS